jgi:hypothetical protein
MYVKAKWEVNDVKGGGHSPISSRWLELCTPNEAQNTTTDFTHKRLKKRWSILLGG